jgi:hypothetical protein
LTSKRLTVLSVSFGTWRISLVAALLYTGMDGQF